jgi:hypothetical protein
MIVRDAQSNFDAITGLIHPLMVQINCPLLGKTSKKYNNSLTVVDTQDMSFDH